MKTIISISKKFILIILIIIGLYNLANSQTVPSYVPALGLAGWWPFNGDGNDISGNLNNATNNGATFVTDRFGIANSAASFNGTTSYLLVLSPSFTFSQGGGFTYAVWLNKQTQTNPAVVLMVGDNTAGNFISNLQGQNEVQFGTNKQQSAWVWTTCPHTLNVWDHYVATYNNGIMKLYKNGVYQSTATFTYTGSYSVNLPLYIGRGIGGNYYTGAIDELGIWNRELTQAEITTLYLGCTLSATASNFANVSCNGYANGSVTVSTPTNGTPPYNYSWNTTPIQNTQTATGLSGGTYVVTVTDATGCSTISSATVTEPTAITNLTASVLTNVTCYGGNNGSATVTTPTGGIPPYTYSWNSTPVQTTQTATGLTANTYIATARDVHNCSATSSVTITQPASDISSHPVNQAVNVSTTVKFIVSSANTAATFIWQTKTTGSFSNLNNTGQYNGVTNDTLTVSNVTLANNNQEFRCIVNYGSCSDTSNIAILTVSNNIGMNEIEGNRLFKVFPNPATKIINVQLASELVGTNYTIMDQIGKIVSTGKVDNENMKIDISNFAIGIYLFRIGNDARQTFKVVMQKIN